MRCRHSSATGNAGRHLPKASPTFRMRPPSRVSLHVGRDWCPYAELGSTRTSGSSATIVTSLVRYRTQVANRVHKDLSIMHPGYERMIPKLTSNRNLRSAKTVLGDDGSVRAHLTRERIDDLELLDARIKQVTTEIEAKVKDSGTTLTQLTGVSFVLAGRILGEVGDVRRLGSKASFAMLNGTAPLEASSGNTRRHRLNRTGNRKLNFVLHRMAIV